MPTKRRSRATLAARALSRAQTFKYTGTHGWEKPWSECTESEAVARACGIWHDGYDAAMRDTRPARSEAKLARLGWR